MLGTAYAQPPAPRAASSPPLHAPLHRSCRYLPACMELSDSHKATKKAHPEMKVYMQTLLHPNAGLSCRSHAMVVYSYCNPAEGRFCDGCSWSEGMHAGDRSHHNQHICDPA